MVARKHGLNSPRLDLHALNGRMAIFDKLKNALTLPGYYAGAVASPFSVGSHLEKVYTHWEHGWPEDIVTRDSAMTVPALARARTLICSTIARLPLVSVDENGEEDGRTPAWLTTGAGHVPPFHRMLWTVDDLFFYGWSLWALDRDRSGEVAAAYRVPFDKWTMDADGIISVEGRPVPEDAVCLIPGISEGILTTAASTLSQALRLLAAADRAALNPSAQVELHQTNDAPMTNEQIDALISRWSAARRGENGGVAFTTAGIEVKEHGASSEHLLIDGRNAAAVDIARHAGIPATMLDATLSGSSLSYQNTAARMAELVTFGLSPLMAAIADRLSSDDMTPPGLTLRFYLDETFSELTNLFASTPDRPGEVAQDPNI